MSNKQSSVEWLFEQQFNSFEKFNNGEFSFAEYMTHNLKLRQQAKAMHKEEMVCSQMDMFNHLNNLPYGLQYLEKRQSAEDFSFQYYKETFGGNNED